MGIENLLLGFHIAITPFNLFMAVVGILLGTIIGVLPGLGGANGVAILLPVTFTMPPTSAIILLTSIYWGALFGGAITSILFNIPGEPWSVATTFDGYPMARQGQGGQALTAAFTSSFVGAFFSIVLITFFAPLLAQIALKFGPPEIFAIQFLTFSSFVGLGGGNPLKSLVSILIGFILATVGLDIVTGQLRLTFGITELMRGFDFIIAVIGLFGIGEILLSVEEGLSFQGTKTGMNLRVVLDTWKILPRYWRTFVRSSFIGFWMGFKPGGATPASFMSYAFAKRFSKNADRFGKGELEGVVAPETAAHAAGVAAMLPMLTLGHSRIAHGGRDARRAHYLGAATGATAIQRKSGLCLGTDRQHVHRQRARRADGPRLRAVVRRHTPNSVCDPDAAHRRGLRYRILRRAQQHARYLVHADLRRGGLRLQEAGLPVGAAGAGAGLRRHGGERAASEFDYVSGFAGDFLQSADRRSDHGGGDLLFYSAHHHPLVEAIPWTTCRSATTARGLNALRGSSHGLSVSS